MCEMVSQHILSGVLLTTATVGIHGAGTLLVLWTLFRVRIHAVRHFGFVHNSILLMSVVVALMAVHVVEVVCWAGFYSQQKCFSDFNTSLYYSLVSYTTVGYGRRGPPRSWVASARRRGSIDRLTDDVLVDRASGPGAHQDIHTPCG